MAVQQAHNGKKMTDAFL